MQAGNIVFSQEDLDVVLSGVALQNEPTIPQISFTNEPIERRIPQKRHVPKLEKPIGRGPFQCEKCESLRPFDTWAKFKKHMRSHENDKR